MFNNLRGAMNGRNGIDALSIAIFVFALILNALTRIFGFPLFAICGVGLAIYAIWRVFSKNLAKRREENFRFSRIFGDARESFKNWRFRRSQKKDFKFFTCPGCKNKLRVPRGRGKINITCPRCGQKFSGKS
ncbi:MAG: hypothetical protein RSD32_05175 [Oscillospiraceae bacterium]